MKAVRLLVAVGAIVLTCAGLWDLWSWADWRPGRIVIAGLVTWILVVVRNRALRALGIGREEE